MLKEIKWLAIIAVALVMIGVWLGHSVWKPEIREVRTIDTLSTHQKDSINAYWTSKMLIVKKSLKVTTNKDNPTKRDTLWQTDSTDVNAWYTIAMDLQRQLDEVCSTTIIEPEVKPATKTDNFSLGVQCGVDYGLQSKDLSPIIACPLMVKRVLVTPFAEYRDEFRVGAMVGMNF